MDETAVKILVNKYLDCVKLLLCETLPENLPAILDDVIHDTTALSEEIKSRRLNGQCDEKLILNAQEKCNLPSNTKFVCELKPLVILERLQINDENLLKDVGNTFKKAKSEKILKSPKPKSIKSRPFPYRTSEKIKRRPLEKVIMTETETINPKQNNPKDQRKPYKSMSDGCCIQ